jgi:hypothetical protein
VTAVPHALAQLLRRRKRQVFIKRRVGIRLAHQDEVEVLG